MKDRIQLLIEILLDPHAREDERDDAAIDLREYKDIRALEALVLAPSNPDEVIDIVDNIAMSIGEVCVRMYQFNGELIERVSPFAGRIMVRYVYNHNSLLIEDKKIDYLCQKWKVPITDLHAFNSLSYSRR